MQYLTEITEKITAAADFAAQEHKADVKQMLMSSAVFSAGMLFANYSFDPKVLEEAISAHENTVRNVVASMVKSQMPAG
jgi:Sec-independent protein secretion pathway component TatC